jgi:uncharacterized zinc-type alcohol dehydrogenase-like protein
MKFNGYAAHEAGEDLAEHKYNADLGDHDVAIKISHCGICHSDIHLVDGDMPMGDFPFIPGHEIVGEITQTGSQVTAKSPGDRVAVGWQCNSCKDCEWCLQGEQHNCPEQQATCVGRNGGFADGIIVNEDFAFHVPDDVQSQDAAPMMCGGITTYTPLSEHATPGDHVAIIGLGGLGHFAVRFADEMGLETTVISTSPEKQGSARNLGADHFVEADDLNDIQGRFDVTVNTAPADLDWDAHIAALRPNGTFVQVGATPGRIDFEPFNMFSMDRQIVGSHIGSPKQIQEMLRFAARNNIQAQTELYSFDDVNEALDAVRQGDVRHRAVLTRQSP